MNDQGYSDHITDEWLVEEVLQRYPSTSDMLFQHGSTQADQLFPNPRINLREYADLRGVSIEALLRSLNAAAETEEFCAVIRGSRTKRTRLKSAQGYTCEEVIFDALAR
jgi:hypothetical protein